MKEIQISKEEIYLYDKLLKSLKWKPDQNNELKRSMFPIMLNGKTLIRVDENTKEYDEKKHIPFIPIFNQKILEFIIGNYIYSDDKISEIVFFKEPQTYQKRKFTSYGGKLLDSKENILYLVNNCVTENDVLFTIIYNYFYPKEDIKDQIYMIHRWKDIKKYKKLDNKKDKNKTDYQEFLDVESLVFD